MSEKRYYVNSALYLCDNDLSNTLSIFECADLLNQLTKENEQLKQELRGMDELLKSYRETIKHDAELLADATRNGYLPPLDDFVKENEQLKNELRKEKSLREYSDMYGVELKKKLEILQKVLHIVEYVTDE